MLYFTDSLQNLARKAYTLDTKERSYALDKFERNCIRRGQPRHDFWLYRRLIAGDELAPHYKIGVNAREILERAAASLEDENYAAGAIFSLCGLARIPVNHMSWVGSKTIDAVKAGMERSIVRLVGQTADERLLLEVCAPLIVQWLGHILDALQKAQAIQGDVRRHLKYYSLEWCNASLKLTVAGLQSVAKSSKWPNWTLRNGIPCHVDERSAGDALPFHRQVAHELTAAAIVETAWRINYVPFDDLKNTNPNDLVRSAHFARDVIQCGWLTIENLPFEVLFERQRSRISIIALARLALLEHYNCNFGLSGNYARFAWDKDIVYEQTWNESAFAVARFTDNAAESDIAKNDMIKKSLWILMSRLMIDIQKSEEGKQFGAITYHPYLPLFLMQADPRLVNTVKAVNDVSKRIETIRNRINVFAVHWNGIDDEPLYSLICDQDYEQTTKAAFYGALLSGNVEVLKRWILGSSDEELHTKSQHLGKYNQEEIRRRLCQHLGKSDVLELADVTSRLYQESILVASRPAFLKLRKAIRKLWCGVGPANLDDMELLFLHHASIGFTHQALMNCAAKAEASKVVYAFVSQQERAIMVHEFAQRIQHGLIRPLRLKDFLNSYVDVPDGQVFISLVTYNDHEVSGVVFAGTRSKPFLIPSLDEERFFEEGRYRITWQQHFENFAKAAGIEVRTGASIESAYSESINKFFQTILKEVLEVEPNAQVLCVHSDAMFRQVPWQHTVSQHRPVKDYLVREMERLQTNACRRLDIGNQLLIMHVPGVNVSSSTVADNNTEKKKKPWKVKRDKNAPECVKFYNSLVKEVPLGTNHKSSFDRLTVISHGIVKGHQARMSGWSPNHIMAKYGRRTVVVLHVCHAGLAITNYLGDMGGLPAYFLANGTKYLVASPLAVTEAAMLAVERQLTMALNLDEVPLNVARSVASSNDIYYDVYSDQTLDLHML